MKKTNSKTNAKQGAQNAQNTQNTQNAKNCGKGCGKNAKDCG